MFYLLKFRGFFILILISFFSGITLFSQPGINEFMSSNNITISDEDGDFSDWIEIYYGGNKTISLAGYGLSDTYEEPFRWVFPDITMFPGQYLIVWASGKDRANPGNPLHTNFSIKAEGEVLLLTSPGGTLVSEVLPVHVPADLSFGRIPDGVGEWFYFNEPTPGGSNTTQGYFEILEPPAFSHSGGFYTDEFYLTISHPDPDATIIYTLDGSTPDTANLEGITFQYKNSYPNYPGDPFGELLTSSYTSYPYSDSLPIIDRSTEPDSLTGFSSTFHVTPYYLPVNPVFKGTVVRAKAFKEGALGSKVSTSTYFVNDMGRHRYKLPVISISLGKCDLFDYENGIYTAGTDYDTWRLNNPDEPHNWLTLANFHRKGDAWEKRSHFEFYEVDSTFPQLSQDIGLRIHGHEARRRPHKSLRLYAHGEYGEAYFNHKFFEDMPDAQFKRLILRNSGQDYYHTFLRDAAMQTIFKDLNFDTQAYQPAIVFLNGEYWGILNIRERYDKYYFERVYEVDPENIDYITNLNEVNEGDMVHYNETISYIDEHGLGEDEHYQYIQTRIDVDNFRDYQIANIFADNHDWPGNNLDYWRLRTAEYQPEAPYGNDGRWRWIMYDMDFGFGLFDPDEAVQHNTLAFATATGGVEYPNPEWATFLLRKFLENYSFRISFINRFADLLNTMFLPANVVGIMDELKQAIEPEMPEHILRWKNLINTADWHTKLAVFNDFAELRPGYQRQHIQEYFNLPGMWELEADVSNRWHGHIRVNTVHIAGGTAGVGSNPYPWEGIYFIGVPVELEAVPVEGYAFSHWEGDVRGTDPVLILSPDEDMVVKAHFIRVDVPRLVTFWLFDTSLPNDTPLEFIDPLYDLTANASLGFHSALAGYPFNPDNPNWRKASMERRNAPTSLNYRPKGNNNIPFENSNMRAIQVKQPFTADGGENILIFRTPTNGYREMTFSFAAKDEGAAQNLLIEYSVVDEEPLWTSDGLANPTPELDNNYQLYVVSFDNIAEADDNPNLQIRIRFTGDNMSADEGNRVTFNNFALDGISLLPDNLPPFVAAPFPYPSLVEMTAEKVFDLNNIFMDPDNDPLSFTIESEYPEMVEITLDGSMMTIYPHRRGGSKLTFTATDSIHPPVDYVVNVGIHPTAFALRNNKFTFTEWSPDEPDFSYPENILFVQSEISDPGLYDPMSFPYFIPHNNYHFEDLQHIGFPYSNSYLTRINGLDEDGISFVNTGEGRDVGGLLLALDTRLVTFADLNWVGQTLMKNDRIYALRVQYRTDINDPFTTLLYKSAPLEYISSETGDAMEFEDIPLPTVLLDKPYVQLLWKYYLVGGTSGERAQIRLDDVFIQDLTNIKDIEKDEIRIFSNGSYIFVRSGETLDGLLSVYDISGRLIKSEKLSNIYYCNLFMHPMTGIFIVRYISNDKVYVRKVFVE